MYRRVHIHVVQPDSAVRSTVDCQRAAEAVGLFVDTPIRLGTQMVWEAERRQHRANETQLFNGYAEYVGDLYDPELLTYIS